MPDAAIPVQYWDYPFVGFSFMVIFTGVSAAEYYECNFQEVSGLNITLTTEDIREGGENQFVHKIPNPPKFENLVLKRGMFKLKDTGLIQWAQKSFSTFNFQPKDIDISLLDENHLPLATWNVKRAYPVGIKISDFKSTENAIVVETLELAFDYFTRTT